MYDKISLVKKTNYAVLVGFAHLCRSAPIMCKIMRAHNHIIPLSLIEVTSLHTVDDVMHLA